MSKFHVDQIATRIRELYSTDYWDANLSDVNNLSRLLARYAVDLTIPESSDSGNQRIVEVIDGGEDRGIDAIGIDFVSQLVVLVQSKWRQDGSGTMDLAGLLKFRRGVETLLGIRTDNVPVSASPEMRMAVSDILKKPGTRMRFIAVTTAQEELPTQQQESMNELLSSVNEGGASEPIASFVHLGQGALFDSIVEREPMDLDLNMQIFNWGKIDEPRRMVYGRVDAAQIAQWYRDHEHKLFAENIRLVIPRSDINDGIRKTLTSEPENFAYFNNEITMVVRDMQVAPAGSATREAGYFTAKGVSIVNGAQTVSTIGRISKSEGSLDFLEAASVMIRCIVVSDEEAEFGRLVTRYANTQNDVSTQDFAFLDAEQHRLKSEIKVMGFEYLLRSGEDVLTESSDKRIDVRSAAIALACAHRDVELSVLVKREISQLFSDRYRTIFNPSTDPRLLVSSVLVNQVVENKLGELEPLTEGVKNGVIIHGKRVISHLILRGIGTTNLSSSEFAIENYDSWIEDECERIVAALVENFPDNSYPGNVFKNTIRVRALLNESSLL